MKFDAEYWKNEMGQWCERVKKDAKEVARMHEASNACGKWTRVVALQMDAMKKAGIKPDSKNMPDLLS